MKQCFENFILVILFVVFIVSGYKIIGYLNETSQSNDVVKSLESVMEKNKTGLIPETETGPLPSGQEGSRTSLDEERMVRLSGFSDLKAINDDFIGWIEIDGTKVNYPVVQGIDDPEYYLKKDFYGRKSSHGSIYMVSECDLDRSCNLVLYGHHMKDGTMFASINKYQDVSYYQEHPVICFDTEYGAHDYEVVGAFRFDADDVEDLETVLSVDTKEKFNRFMGYVEDLSYYDTDAIAKYGDELLTLMTCEYTYDNGRFFVVAKKIR